MLALRDVMRDTGRYGESIRDATSELADPNYYGPGSIGYVASHRVNYAEAAVEQYRKDNEKLPLGADIYVERVEYE